MTLEKALSDAEIFKEASEETMKYLKPFCLLQRKRKGEHIFRDKEEVKQIYIVAGGFASIYKCSSEGEKKVIFVYGPGKALNEVALHNLPTSSSCEMLADGYIISIPKGQLLKAMEADFNLTKNILDSMSVKIRRLYRQLKNTANSVRGDKKIAAKLWKLSYDYGKPVAEGSQIEIEMTITYLADMLGSKRETVSRQLKVLMAEGLVLYKNGRFIIPDQDKLGAYFKSP